MAAKILIVDTENRGFGRMAQAWLCSFDPQLKLYLAESAIDEHLNAVVISVLGESGVKLPDTPSLSIEESLADSWDYVLSFSTEAQSAPLTFTGRIGDRWHFYFDDFQPSGSAKSEIERYAELRDEMRAQLRRFYATHLTERSTCACGANDFCRCQ